MHLPVDDVLCMQMLQAARDFSSIENSPLLLEARVTHVVYVELEVSAVHQSQHETQSVLHLKRVR